MWALGTPRACPTRDTGTQTSFLKASPRPAALSPGRALGRLPGRRRGWRGPGVDPTRSRHCWRMGGGAQTPGCSGPPCFKSPARSISDAARSDERPTVCFAGRSPGRPGSLSLTEKPGRVHGGARCQVRPTPHLRSQSPHAGRTTGSPPGPEQAEAQRAAPLCRNVFSSLSF